MEVNLLATSEYMGPGYLTACILTHAWLLG
jgi:hypothetical protein